MGQVFGAAAGSSGAAAGGGVARSDNRRGNLKHKQAVDGVGASRSDLIGY